MGAGEGALTVVVEGICQVVLQIVDGALLGGRILHPEACMDTQHISYNQLCKI